LGIETQLFGNFWKSRFIAKFSAKQTGQDISWHAGALVKLRFRDVMPPHGLGNDVFKKIFEWDRFVHASGGGKTAFGGNFV
jgi:hypothetical protein